MAKLVKEDKTFTIAGTSVHPDTGERNWRFANGTVGKRTSVLKFHGHTEIELSELPSPMTKQAAILWMQEQGKQAKPPMGMLPPKAKPAEEPTLVATQTDEELEAEKRAARNAKRRAARAAAKAAKTAKTPEEAAEEVAADLEGLGVAQGAVPEAVAEAVADTVAI